MRPLEILRIVNYSSYSATSSGQLVNMLSDKGATQPAAYVVIETDVNVARLGLTKVEKEVDNHEVGLHAS